jgi:hypothetical protein
MKLRMIAEEFEKRRGLFYYQYRPAGQKHFDFHRSLSHVKGLIGANRSGKTTTVIQEVAMLMSGEHPFIELETPNYWWWVEPNFKKVVETDGAFQKWERHIPPNLVKQKVRQTSGNLYKIILHNGSEITFKSQEEDVNSFTSAKLHGAVVNERITDDEKRLQIRMRTLDVDGYLFFTMDALRVDEWLEDLIDRGMVDYWRIETRENKTISKTGLDRISKELSENDRKRLLQGIAVDENQSVLFTKEMLGGVYVEKPYNTYSFDRNSGDFIDDENGYIRVFEVPQNGREYVISVDTAKGRGGDDSVIQVFTTDTREQVCVANSNQIEVIPFAHVVAFIANHYNDALVAVENDNGFGSTLIEKLKELPVNMYFEKIAEYRGGDINFGVQMNQKNKIFMVNWMVEDVMNQNIIIHDKYTKEQLSYFIEYRTKTGTLKYKGRGKKHDDLAMSVMLANRTLRILGYNNKTAPANTVVKEKEEKLVLYVNGRNIAI